MKCRSLLSSSSAEESRPFLRQSRSKSSNAKSVSTTPASSKRPNWKRWFSGSNSSSAPVTIYPAGKQRPSVRLDRTNTDPAPELVDEAKRNHWLGSNLSVECIHTPPPGYDDESNRASYFSTRKACDAPPAYGIWKQTDVAQSTETQATTVTAPFVDMKKPARSIRRHRSTEAVKVKPEPKAHYVPRYAASSFLSSTTPIFLSKEARIAARASRHSELKAMPTPAPRQPYVPKYAGAAHLRTSMPMPRSSVIRAASMTDLKKRADSTLSHGSPMVSSPVCSIVVVTEPEVTSPPVLELSLPSNGQLVTDKPSMRKDSAFCTEVMGLASAEDVETWNHWMAL
ncbi:hypothetical protein B0A49_07618 [Cryomyces minteri]|uniref:Uncharacterized protein n=1 Tax=Cryomyces minteri TaxID=331657 RepID=A0A4U0X871_9PEZI|nr:hypothetical protein B0A49_07618 [Cryomyces minteri]